MNDDEELRLPQMDTEHLMQLPKEELVERLLASEGVRKALLKELYVLKAQRAPSNKWDAAQKTSDTIAHAPGSGWNAERVSAGKGEVKKDNMKNDAKESKEETSSTVLNIPAEELAESGTCSLCDIFMVGGARHGYFFCRRHVKIIDVTLASMTLERMPGGGNDKIKNMIPTLKRNIILGNMGAVRERAKVKGQREGVEFGYERCVSISYLSYLSLC